MWRAVGAAPESLARNIHKVQTSKVGTGGELARDGKVLWPFGAADNLAPLPEFTLSYLDRVPALGPGT